MNVPNALTRVLRSHEGGDLLPVGSWSLWAEDVEDAEQEVLLALVVPLDRHDWEMICVEVVTVIGG